MCLGPFKRACHWGPLVALAIIKSVTMSAVSCLSQWWPPWATLGGTLFFISFMTSAILTLYFFMLAMFTGPGNVTKGWKPVNEEDCDFLQFCTTCESFKPPRAHHCRKCGHCNLKMDHHCPWVNNCVGHRNHTSFTMFLFFAVVGCAQGAVIIAASIYKAIHRTYYLYYGSPDEHIVTMTLWSLVINMFVLGLAIGVVIAVGMLLYFQLRGIIRNRTGIEDWIVEKANYRRDSRDGDHKPLPFVYPYNLGRWKNFCQVVNVFCEPVGDGVTWPVRDGCNQFTLTIEQLEQKEEKRWRSREYVVTSLFSGYWLPVRHGFSTCIRPPCTDEPRLPLTLGESILVTRWKSYWLYGRLANSKEEVGGKKRRDRGWFPRCCVVEVMSSPHFGDQNNQDKKER